MPESLSCPQGHRWEPATVPATVGHDGRPRCPVCGAPALDGSKPKDAGGGLPPASTGWVSISTVTCQPVPAADDTSLPRVPGYEIQGTLGSGGMGVVYRAWQTKLKRLVALKMIRSGTSAGPEQLARFRSEAEAVAALQHPNIVQIFDVGEADGLPYCALEFVDGGSLARAIGGKPQPADAAAQLTETLARAMHYCHQRGIIHRDLKPANILLAPNPKSEVGNPKSEIRNPKSGISPVRAPADSDAGISDFGFRISDFVPKITDFGLAKQMEDDSGQTRSGAVMGTPCYMAPEQAEGKTHEIGPLADVYALGAILYELLAGRPPFRGATALETMRQVVSQEPLPPSRFHPRLPRDLDTICLKCLAKEPAQRYRSALMLAQDLERFRAGESILARREGVARRAWRKVRRRPLASVAAVLLAVALAAAVYFGLSAASSNRLAAWKSFEAGLETRQWTPEVLHNMEALLAEVERQSPAEAGDARARLRDRYAQAIRESFAARLDDEQVPAIQANIESLEERDAELGRQVREELRNRLRRMEPFLTVAPPFDALDTVFMPGEVQKQTPVGELTHLVSRVGLANGYRVLTKVSCRGDVRLEASFSAPSWLDASRLGLILSMVPSSGRGYTLWIGSSPGKPKETLPSFAQARANPEAKISVQIDRDGVRQREQSFDASLLTNQPLSLRATRKQDLIIFEVFQGDKLLAGLRFRDAFPASDADASVFGLIWPGSEPAAAARLERLEFSRQLLPLDPSPLERGDELYAQGKLADALVQYQAQERASSQSEVRQEARCKQGLCLAGLHRDDEAVGLLAPLLSESGDRWPVVAACRLWALYLAQQRDADADALFDTLLARGISHEQLSTLIPEDTRAAILGSYVSESGGQNLLYFVDAQRVRRFERIAAIQRLFSADPLQQHWPRLFLVRAYRAAGEKERTLAALNSLLRDVDPVAAAVNRLYLLEEYAWVMRERGEPGTALAEVERHLQNWPEQYRMLLLARARLLVMLGRWQEAERDVEDLFRQPPKTGWDYAHLSAACLVRGFLRERRGDKAGALEAWRPGLLNARVNSVKYQEVITGGNAPIGGSIGLLNAILLGSLTNDLSDADAELFQSWLANSISPASPLSGGKELRLPGASLRAMCQTPRGREATRKLAYQSVSWAEFCRIPLVVVAAELLHQGAFPGEMSAENEAIVWQVAEDGATGVLAGRIKNVHGAQLALTWKGFSGALGWKSLAPSLEAVERGRLAYVFGHRYLRRQQPKEAADFFRTAIADAPSDANVKRLAQMELDRLKGK